MINRNELRIVGMSRSGNHAIINWIVRQITSRCCFLNCAEPRTNPFVTARPLAGDSVYHANYDAFDLDAERRGRFSEKDFLLHSYEDCYLGMVASDIFERNHDAFVGPSGRRVDVLILRDPYNLFASRRRASYACVSDRVAMRIWRQHAREYLGRCRYLNQEQVFVLYNRWVRDAAYRRRVAERLGLAFTDAGVDEVPAVGRGSSFDGRRYHGAAGRMPVTERWRHYADDPAYLALFDEATVALADAVFGPSPLALAGRTT